MTRDGGAGRAIHPRRGRAAPDYAPSRTARPPRRPGFGRAPDDSTLRPESQAIRAGACSSPRRLWPGVVGSRRVHPRPEAPVPLLVRTTVIPAFLIALTAP